MPGLTDSSNKAPAALDQLGAASGGWGGSVLGPKTPLPLHAPPHPPSHTEQQGHAVPRSCENELGDLCGITVHGARAGVLLIWAWVFLSPSLLSFLPSFSLSLPPFFLKQILCVKHCPKHFAKRSHLILRTTYKAETTIFVILIYRLGYFGMRNLINSPVLTQPVSGWVKIQTHILWTSFLHSATLPLLSAKNNNQ